MPKPRPPYLIHKTRNGRTDWYYWKRPGPQIRIKGEYGSREFWTAYQIAAEMRVEPHRKESHAKATFAWLIAEYRQTSEWTNLSAATRRQRENIFTRIITHIPTLLYAEIDRPLIMRSRDAKKHTPSAANHFIAAMKGLFNWAVDAGLVASSPVANVKNVKRPKTDGFRMWTEEDIAAFSARWPIGSRERLALEILLNTGLRRGDAARLGRQHIRGGRLLITTEKTGTSINIPIPQPLLAILDASETGDLTLITHKRTNRGMSKEGFGNWFRKAAQAAGVDGNYHGLRKTAATRLAEAGATIPEQNAVFGWTGSAMALRYIEKASRQKLSDSAVLKLGH